MDDRTQLEPQRRALLDALVQDRLNQVEQSRLVELLTGDAEFRRAYVESMSMIAGIRRYLRGADLGALSEAFDGIDALQPIRSDPSADDDNHSETPPVKPPPVMPPSVMPPSVMPPSVMPPPVNHSSGDPHGPLDPFVPDGGSGPAIPAPGPMISDAAMPGGSTSSGASAMSLVMAPRSDQRPAAALRELVAGIVRVGARGVRRPALASLVVAAGCLGAVLLATLGGSRDDDQDPSGQSIAATVPGESDSTGPVAQAEGYVARVVLVSPDVVWGEPRPALDFFLRARTGDKLNVAAGLVQVEFFSGAKVILHGPSVFVPTGPSSGQLESGRLTGEVDGGNFRLVTPSAEVVDLGTAFGVTTDAATGTDVVVFDGRVQAVSRPTGLNSGEVLDMTEGMAARFRSDGVTEYGLRTDVKKFTRRMPSRGARQNLDEICLIDVLAGGDGLGTHLAGAIDAATGRRDYGAGGRQLEISGRPADGVFHPVDWQPLIDGVFIPRADGLQVQLDSLGRRVALPANCGWTHGSIWARRRESALEPTGGLDIDFWGNRTLQGVVKRLKESRLGLLGIHANAGMTFDLRKIQLVHRRPPGGFGARVANVENSGDWSRAERPVIPAKRTVDFRVFVDGALRFQRLGFRREDGEQEFAVALSPGDRFLSVVATDDGGDLDYDHLVLIDPVIALDNQ